MKVKNHMSPNPVTVTPNVSVDQALHLMREHGIRHLPVLEDGQVKDLMAPSPQTVAADATIYQAARLLHNGRITGLVVLDQGRVAGIITLTDVLAVLVEILGLLSETVRLDVRLRPEPGMLDQVHSVISRHGGRVISLALVSSDGEHRVYSFRLEKMDLGPMMAELRAAGLEVWE